MRVAQYQICGASSITVFAPKEGQVFAAHPEGRSYTVPFLLYLMNHVFPLSTPRQGPRRQLERLPYDAGRPASVRAKPRGGEWLRNRGHRGSAQGQRHCACTPKRQLPHWSCRFESCRRCQVHLMPGYSYELLAQSRAADDSIREIQRIEFSIADVTEHDLRVQNGERFEQVRTCRS